MHNIIVLGSANGSRNLGDECMWESLVDYIRTTQPEVKITTDALPGWTPKFPNVSVLPMLADSMKVDAYRFPNLSNFANWNALTRGLSRFGRNRRVEKLVRDRLHNGPRTPLEQEWYEAIRQSDALFISGAGGMTDQYSVHGIFSWWLLAGWAKAIGIPVYAVGQGVGPISNEKLRSPLTELLNSLSYLGVREQRSLEFAESLVDTHVQVDQTFDWALGIQVSDEDRTAARNLTENAFGDTPYIALSLHLHQPLAVRRRSSLQKAAESIIAEAASRGYCTLFVPNMTGLGHSDDRALADQIISKLPSNLQNSVAVHRSQSDARIVRALLHNAIGLFATRYHPLVFSFTEGTPVIGMYFDEYYNQKLSGASALFGVADNTAPVSLVSSQANLYFEKLKMQKVRMISAEEINKNLFDPLTNAMRVNK